MHAARAHAHTVKHTKHTRSNTQVCILKASKRRDLLRFANKQTAVTITSSAVREKTNTGKTPSPDAVRGVHTNALGRDLRI